MNESATNSVVTNNLKPIVAANHCTRRLNPFSVFVLMPQFSTALNGEMVSQSQTQTQSQSNQLNHNSLQPKPQSHPNQANHLSNPPSHLNIAVDPNKDKKPRNYKLIVDPALKKGPTKVYRYDGLVPGVGILI